jgi:predicted DNA-binding protein YlxM (UPF0122 family)
MRDLVAQIIDRHNLISRSRKLMYVNKRSFLMLKLHNDGYNLRQIGELFRLNHATVIHNIKRAEWFEKTNERIYLEDTREIRLELMNYPAKRNLDNLVSDVLDCKSIRGLEQIQVRLLKNQYEFNLE